MSEAFVGVSAVSDDRPLYRETNSRFWASTEHKRDQNLDPRDLKDREMAKLWLQIFAGVRGHRDQATELARRIYTETLTPYIFVSERHGILSHQPFNDRAAADQQYALAKSQPALHRYIALFDFTKNPQGPLYDEFPATATAPLPPRPPRSDTDRAGAALAVLREQTRSIARRAETNVVGVVKSADGRWFSPPFMSREEAVRWLDGVTKRPMLFTYAAIFDKTDRMWPYAITEAIGHATGSSVAGW